MLNGKLSLSLNYKTLSSHKAPQKSLVRVKMVQTAQWSVIIVDIWSLHSI